MAPSGNTAASNVPLRAPVAPQLSRVANMLPAGTAAPYRAACNVAAIEPALTPTVQKPTAGSKWAVPIAVRVLLQAATAG